MFGKNLDAYGSELFKDPMKVVEIGFNGYDLGKTTDATTLQPDVDIKDVLYQQDGTKAADHVVTGCDWLLSCTFGEIKTSLLALLVPYLFGSSGHVGADSGYIYAAMNKSLKDNYAGVLKVAPLVNGVPSGEVEDTMYFYIAIPVISSNLINWGADVQRNLPIDFRIKIKRLTAAESTTHVSSHGYFGDPSVEDLPAAAWPDLEAPYITAAVASAATTITLTTNETVSVISGVTEEEKFIVLVEDIFIVPTTVVVSGTSVTLTLPASSITAGDDVKVSMAAGVIEDADDNANETINDFIVTNNVT